MALACGCQAINQAVFAKRATLVVRALTQCNLTKAFMFSPRSITNYRILVAGSRFTTSAYNTKHWRQFHVGYSSLQAKEDTNFNIQDGDDFLQNVIKAAGPVLVDFHAEWCGPCKLVGPKLEAAVDKQGEKIKLAKLNVDDHGSIAMKYKVMVVPTVLLFKNGKVVDKFEGNIQDKDLEDFVSRAIQ